MRSEHYKKQEFEILSRTNFTNIDNYLLIKSGFNIKKDGIHFDIENQRLVNQMKENYKFIRYRLKYNNYSIFFSEEELKNANISTITKYQIIDVDKKENKVKQKVPLETRIKYNGTPFGFFLNNVVLIISYDDIVKTSFDLEDDPSIELNKNNGNIVHYISESNTLLFNGSEKYLNIKEAILEGLIEYRDTFTHNILGKEYTIKNVLIFNNKIIGTIENTNEIYLNNNMIVCAKISGNEFNISYGIQANMKEYENMLYYESIDQLISESSFEEFYENDLVYFQDVNKVFVCKKDKLYEVNFKNVIFSTSMPDNSNIGSVWLDTTIGILYVYDGYLWKELSDIPLSDLVIKMDMERKLGIDRKDNFLEVFAFNEKEEFRIMEMKISTPITKDVQFSIDDSFIQAVYVNGIETFEYNEANYGINLIDTLFKGDLIQVVLSKNKEYEWVNGIVEDEDIILITHPKEVRSIKKIVINKRMYLISNIDQNRIKINDLISLYNEPIILNKCDRIKAQVKLTNTISQAYPQFSVDYKEDLKEVEIPFNLSKTRFDNLMITNNGDNVIVNPQILLEQDRLYAYYNPNKPNIIGFSRLIRPDDNVIVQFMSHIECNHNPDTFFEVIQSEKDIIDKTILDGIESFEDETISLQYWESEIDDILNKDKLNSQNNNGSNNNVGNNGGNNNNSSGGGGDGSNSESGGDGSGNNDSGNNSNQNENINITNNEKDPSYPFISINETDEAKINNLIKDSISKAKPDYSTVALASRPVVQRNNKPVLAKPSRLEYRPVVQKFVTKTDKYSNYNLEFTRQYFKAKDKLKNYLQAASDRFATAVQKFANIRDSLRSLINYICNTLCLAEVLRFVEMMFKSITNALKALFSMSLDEFVSKVNKLLSKIGGAVYDGLKDVLKVLGLEAGGLVGAVMQGVSNLMGMVEDAINGVQNIVDDALNRLTEGIDALNKISGLFSLFDFSLLGLLLGNFFGKIFKKLMESLSKLMDLIGGAIGSFFNMLSEVSNLLKAFDLTMFKNFTLFTNLANLIDFICNKVLDSLLNLLDAIVDILDYLQKRFQDLIDALFADKYRCKWSILDRLGVCGEFFKSHVDICEALRDMMEDYEMSLAGFIKRTTNLESIIKTWKDNKKIIKEAINESNTMNNMGGCLAGSLLGFENVILSIDDMFGNNTASLDKLVRKLKKAFIPTFKTRVENVLDVESMSKVFYNKEEWTELKKKITWL